MNDLEFNPAYWRLKAVEPRAVADTLQNSVARGHMRSAAASFDRLAQLAERQPAKPRPKAVNSN